MQQSTIIYSTIRLNKPIPVTRKFTHMRWVETGPFIYPHEETVSETIFVTLVKIGRGHDGIIRDFQLTEDDGTFVPCKCCPSLYQSLYEKYTGLKKIPDYTDGNSKNYEKNL